MGRDRDALEKVLQYRLEKLRKTPIPKGYADACGDIDVLLYEFDGYVVGLVSSLLQGSDLGGADIDKGTDIEEGIRRCRNTLDDFATYKRMLDDLVEIIEGILADRARAEE